jgi:glyoxylase-like metal-dependent hydrolase (beta-lactamase superfamily II)
VIIEKIIVGEMETNCYLVADARTKEAVIIDPGGEPEKIKRYIKKHNLNCLYIINTHGHIDHIGANNDFDIPTLVHEKDAPFLCNAQLNLASFVDSAFTSRKAGRLLRDGEEIEIGSLNFKVIHTPGHTPGSVCLRLDDFLFTGDTLFAQGVGRTDFPYSSQADLMKSIKEKLFTLKPETKIFPGHGPASTIGAERENFMFFKNG